MRKKISNRKSLITLIFVGLFTIMAFIFDQLVIFQEGEYRKLEEKIFDKKKAVEDKINSSVIFQLTAAKLDHLIYSYATRYEVLFNIVNLSHSNSFLETVRKTNKKFYSDYYDIQTDKLIGEMFYQYSFILLSSKLSLSEEFNVFDTDNFSKDKDSSKQDIENLISQFNNYRNDNKNLENLILVDSAYHATNRSIRKLSIKYNKIGKKLEDEGFEELDEINLIAIDLNKKNSYKNTFIILSIFSQILSLALLVYLFKQIINNIQYRAKES